MNFECDDTICTNAQACQNQIKKLLKSILFNISKRKPQHFLDPSPEKISEFCYELGSKQIEECLQFIQNGENFLARYGSQFEQSTASECYQVFDNVMFDLISGLFQTNKMVQPGHIPGSFVKGLIEAINRQHFFKKLI